MIAWWQVEPTALHRFCTIFQRAFSQLTLGSEEALPLKGSFHWWEAPWGWYSSSCYSQAQPACHGRLILLCEAQLQPPKAFWGVLRFRIWPCLRSGSQDSAAVSMPPKERERAWAQTQNHLNSAAIGMVWAWIWPGWLELCQIVSGHT